MTRAAAMFVLIVAAAFVARPAHAVVGGKPVPATLVPWFATLDGCGGTLVAPDRIATAGHCVRGLSPADLKGIRVGGVVRNGVRFAMHPDWQRANGTNVLDDVAIIQLDQPVPNVTPVPIGDATAKMTVLGRGNIRYDRRGNGLLREARLRTVPDSICVRNYRRLRGNDGERFNAPRMLCSIDLNGRPPLSSACVGDSGGPLYSGSHAQPVLVGIVSFGGDRCGADRLPSVFAEAARYRDFLVALAPVWAPAPTGPATITGKALRGGKLTCAVPGWDTPPSEVSTFWLRDGQRIVGRGSTHRVLKGDVRHTLSCVILAAAPGGVSGAPPARVKITA